MRLVFTVVILLCLVRIPAQAEDYQCPKKVTSILQNTFSIEVSSVLRRVYQELGCETRFIPRPGKRALMEFNSGKYDGETMRLTIAEKSYSIDFVRSEEPLLNFTGSHWVSPNLNNQKKRPMGYVRGILWQEKQAKGKNSVAFNGNPQLFAAYNSGSIHSLIAADYTIINAIKSGQFETPPVRQEEVFSAPLYHYLAKEFTPFMKTLSAYLKEHDVFSKQTLKSN